MRNQNLSKYFNGDKAILTWEISGGIQLPLEGQPRGLFSSLDELPRTRPPIKSHQFLYPKSCTYFISTNISVHVYKILTMSLALLISSENVAMT